MGRILVVDDEKEIADLLEVYLQNDGYTVLKAYNGTDALKYAESEEIDLAILGSIYRKRNWGIFLNSFIVWMMQELLKAAAPVLVWRSPKRSWKPMAVRSGRRVPGIRSNWK